MFLLFSGFYVHIMFILWLPDWYCWQKKKKLKREWKTLLPWISFLNSVRRVVTIAKKASLLGWKIGSQTLDSTKLRVFQSTQLRSKIKPKSHHIAVLKGLATSSLIYSVCFPASPQYIWRVFYKCVADLCWEAELLLQELLMLKLITLSTVAGKLRQSLPVSAVRRN